MLPSDTFDFCVQFCKPGGSRAEGPLHESGVWQAPLAAGEAALLEEVMSACTPSGQARAYLALGVSMWDRDRAVARQRIESAVQILEDWGDRIEERLYQDICVAFAECAGMPGVLRITRLLAARPPLFSLKAADVAAAAVKASPAPRDLIRILWDSAREVPSLAPNRQGESE